MTETPNTSQDYLNFLIETLQKIEKNPNPQAIYPFWVQNIDKLDDKLVHILDSWSKNILSSAKAEDAKSIAYNVFNVSTFIQEFPLGNIDINQEIAITGYEICLNIVTSNKNETLSSTIVLNDLL